MMPRNRFDSPSTSSSAVIKLVLTGVTLTTVDYELSANIACCR